ncbi:Homoaconitase, mitochondrial [Metarhizium anisopliae]|nr:Homoaconitase, mitochondrial [Metarhizium anisopliae]
MAAFQRVIALSAGTRLRPPTLIADPRSLSVPLSHGRACISTGPRSQYAFHSQLESSPNAVAPSSPQRPPAPALAQTLTEKIVQRYSTDLPPGKKVKAGDYVTLSVLESIQGCMWLTLRKENLAFV